MFSCVINTYFTVVGARQGPVSSSSAFPRYLVQVELMPKTVLNTHMGTGEFWRGASCIRRPGNLERSLTHVSPLWAWGLHTTLYFSPITTVTCPPPPHPHQQQKPSVR